MQRESPEIEFPDAGTTVFQQNIVDVTSLTEWGKGGRCQLATPDKESAASPTILHSNSTLACADRTLATDDQGEQPHWTEEERLAALFRTGLLDTPPEQAFDDLTRLAADLVGVPIAAMHFVAEDRQWGKAEIGLGFCDLPRDISFCSMAMLDMDGLEVPDTTKDPRFFDNPLVTGGPGIRFYAGMPLIAEGLPVGALCVIDTQPHERGLTKQQRFALKALASQASNQIALRRALADRDHADALQRQANATMRAQEDRLRLAVTVAGLGTFDFCVASGDLTWDDRCRALFGVSPGAPVSYESTFLAGLHPDDREIAVTAMQRSMDPTGTGSFSCEYRTLGVMDDVERWVSAKGETLFEDGLPVRLAGTLQDVTDRKRAEAAAQVNDQRVQLALAAGAIIGTWFWDMPNDCFTVDDAFARAFGLDPALGRVGLSLEQVLATVHPEDRAGLGEAIDKAILRGGAYAHQYRVRRADGHYYWIEANGRVDHALDGTPLSFPGVLIDLERRRIVEGERDRAIAELRALTDTLEQRVAERTTELLRTEEQLRQSQKMEAVGQLTGGVAHDFNNLLAAISGSLELMHTRINQGRFKDVERYVAAADGATKRATALTQRLLAFSRQQTLAPKATDIDTMVDGMLDLIRRTVGPSVQIKAAGKSGLWPALVDQPQIENALLNLCINARDAMPDGGTITIETSNRRMGRQEAKQHDMPEGEYISLCVADTGIGMPPEVIAKAFDPFFTTKPLGQGTGLGLSMIYGFTKQSGGQVCIHSKIGRGTTVCIYLPRHRGEIEKDEEVNEAAERPSAKADETVLVVDDEPALRMLVADVLGDFGYTVIEAADGAGGLRVLQSDTRIDLLVTDIGLPGGMNGRQMADMARIARPELAVLFITGFAETALFGNEQLAAGMAVLTKPFLINTLADRVRELTDM